MVLDEINQAVGGETRLLPWEIRPYELIGWWDMQAFSARAFYEIGRTLANVQRNTEDIITLPGYSRNTLMGATVRESKSATSQIENIRENCQAIGLTVSLKAIERLNALRTS